MILDEVSWRARFAVAAGTPLYVTAVEWPRLWWAATAAGLGALNGRIGVIEEVTEDERGLRFKARLDDPPPSPPADFRIYGVEVEISDIIADEQRAATQRYYCRALLPLDELPPEL